MCHNCNRPTCTTPNACYEARLILGLSTDQTMVVGQLDGVPIVPIKLKTMVQTNETNTSLRFDSENEALIFESEKAKNGKSIPDSIPVSQILSAAQLDQIGGVGPLVEGGLANVALVDNELTVVFTVPEPAQSNELPDGFIAYVPNPVDGGSKYRTISPTPGGTTDSILLGHPDGSIEFSTPITSPVLVSLNTLTSNGEFSGTPATASGSWRYQTMGTTESISNDSGSQVEVELFFRYSMQVASATRNGIYCRLVNGGSDYQTEFIEGVNNIKQEGYPGGMARFRCILDPNQKCQFEFGGFEDAPGAMTLTIGSTDEAGEVAVPPVITIRRQI